MNTQEINKYLADDKIFIGTYPVDFLPNIAAAPATIIVNTDPSTKPGEHWVAIYVKRNRKGIYFDSYGLPPLNEEIKTFLNSECANGWKYNNIQLQPVDRRSKTCGQYCIMFCKAMSNKISFKKFLRLFSKFHNWNDVVINLAIPIKSNTNL